MAVDPWVFPQLGILQQTDSDKDAHCNKDMSTDVMDCSVSGVGMIPKLRQGR
jgi:hypothetical protein